MKSYIMEDAYVRIDKLVPGGQALATLPDGKKAFFWNALPGEIVTSYQITKSKSSYLEAVALTVTDHSPHRIAPRDDCYLSTSPWQIMDYDYELRQKVALVEECFRQAATGPATLGDASAQTDGRAFHYRNKMEYSLYWDNSTGKISLAFHARGSHRKIPIESSSLEHPEILAKAQEIIAGLNARGEEARRYQSLMLRCDQQGHVSGGLFENGQPHPDFPPLTDTILGHQYTYSPNGFFQINLPVYELALREIAKHIDTEKVLDLYAGVGTIGLSVARDRELTLVEVNKAAYAELVENCKRASNRFSKNIPQPPSKNHNMSRSEDSKVRAAGPTDCCNFDKGGEDHSEKNDYQIATPILTSAEDALDFITPDETVILDPPRAGCHPKLLAKLTEQTPPTIIYLSCNPITQARDIQLLSPKYHITTAKTFNFFPRTPHIENLVVLTKHK